MSHLMTNQSGEHTGEVRERTRREKRATAGSDALFSDDESAESSHTEDEESDAGETDELWAEGFTFNEE